MPRQMTEQERREFSSRSSVASGGVDHEGGVGGFAEARKTARCFGEHGSLRDVVAYLVAATT